MKELEYKINLLKNKIETIKNDFEKRRSLIQEIEVTQATSIKILNQLKILSHEIFELNDREKELLSLIDLSSFQEKEDKWRELIKISPAKFMSYCYDSVLCANLTDYEGAVRNFLGDPTVCGFELDDRVRVTNMFITYLNQYFIR